MMCVSFFVYDDSATTTIYPYRLTLALHDALPICVLCRDASTLTSAKLSSAIGRVFEAIPGFHFVRLDLRCPSTTALSTGRDLRILEVNGVTAEAAHIYHPGAPLLAAYRSMFRQWRIAFEIGAANAARGADLTGPFGLLRRFRADLNPGQSGE